MGFVFDARNLYYTVLLRLAQLGVQKKKLVSAQEVERITRALVNAGRLAPIELNRTEIRLHNQERSLQNARVSYWQTLNEAKDRVGVSRDTVVVFTSTLTYTSFQAGLEKLIDYAYIHQPSIRTARRNVELSQIGLREAEEVNNARFNVTSTLGLADTTGGTVADLQKSWSAQIGMVWPFFDSRKTYYTVLANKENLSISRLQLQSAERSTQVQISNSYVDVKRTEEQIMGFDANRNQAQENVRIVKARFSQGLDKLIEIFFAEDQLRDIELEYLNLLFVYSQSVDALSRLVGGDSRRLK